MIVTSRAIVLQVRKHGESSRIVTLYSRAYGKISVIAKGARQLKSKFGASLDQFTELEATFYYNRERSGLYLLSKAESVHSNLAISSSLERIQCASIFAELLLRTQHEEEENPPLYELLAAMLVCVSRAHEAELRAIELQFYLRFISLSGFRFEKIEGTLADDTIGLFNLRTGEVLKIRYAPLDDERVAEASYIRISADCWKVLAALERASLEACADVHVDEHVYLELRELFFAYLTEHVESLRGKPLNSRMFMPLR